MRFRRQTFLIVLICFIALIIIGIQIYWNYNNYRYERKQLVQDVKAIVATSLDQYSKEIAQRNVLTFQSRNGEDILQNKILDSLINRFKFGGDLSNVVDQRKREDSAGIVLRRGSRQKFVHDSIIGRIEISGNNLQNLEKFIHKSKNIFQGSSTTNPSQVTFSVSVDTINISFLNRIIDANLRKNNMGFDYGYVLRKDGSDQYYNKAMLNANYLHFVLEPLQLIEGSKFDFYFIGESELILKRSWIGLMLSIVLVVIVLSALVYFLVIIRNQKELDEMKNDLVNTVTHELKTPISIIKVALESIERFNRKKESGKIDDYLDISTKHLTRLSDTVEKILETTSLESGELQMQKKVFDLNQLLQKKIIAYQAISSNKNIKYWLDSSLVNFNGDAFHLENVIDNFLENAIKYGGDEIMVKSVNGSRHIKLYFEDSGQQISSRQAKYIFNKFYRIPGGNTRKTNGFGIGLYYSKSIIEQHKGTVELRLQPNTTFIITLPHE